MNFLENHVRKVARALHEHQIARLYKIPNDIKIVDNQLHYAERTPVDFMGFTITGRVIMLECKMCKAASLGLNASGLKAHQLIAITEAHKTGGMGLLAWQKMQTIAVIDAGQVVAYSRDKGRKSIAWKDIPSLYKHSIQEDPVRLLFPFVPIPVPC